MDELFDVAIRDETIKLGQFVKLANLVETGGEAKELIAQGQVTVNGIVDTRRGKTLKDGDVVAVSGQTARVRANSLEEDENDFDEEKWRNM